MFQMNKKLFNQCWPVLAAQIRSGVRAAQFPDGVSAPMPSSAAAAEAGYVLGIAMGYALGADRIAAAANQLSASIRGWQVEACGGMNWPQVLSSRMPGACAPRRH